MKIFLFILWFSFLSIPFAGIKGALYLFSGISAAYIIFILIKKTFAKIKAPQISDDFKNILLNKKKMIAKI